MPLRRGRRRSTAPRALLRAAAGACIAAALIVPPLRRRLGSPAPLTLAISVSGPLALTVVWPRSKKRDAALFALQMWGFLFAHEMPYDEPEALERRLRWRYPITVDHLLGAGTLPSERLQRALARLGRANALDRLLTWAHWLWFLEPYVAMAWILIRHNERFPRAARQLAATYDIGCAIYYLVPTAPPWWAAEQGFLGEDVERRRPPGEARAEAELRRIMVEVGEQTWRGAWPRMYESLGGNPWAAMPSLHFATSLMAAIHLGEAGRAEGAAGWGYAATLGFALVYLGEHYVTDLVAGATLVWAVRRGEPIVEPAVLFVNRGLQRLEQIASG